MKIKDVTIQMDFSHIFKPTLRNMIEDAVNLSYRCLGVFFVLFMVISTNYIWVIPLFLWFLIDFHVTFEEKTEKAASKTEN